MIIIHYCYHHDSIKMLFSYSTTLLILFLIISTITTASSSSSSPSQFTSTSSFTSSSPYLSRLTRTDVTCSPFQLKYHNEACAPHLNQHCAPFLDCIDGHCALWNENLLNYTSTTPTTTTTSSTTTTTTDSSLSPISSISSISPSAPTIKSTDFSADWLKTNEKALVRDANICYSNGLVAIKALSNGTDLGQFFCAQARFLGDSCTHNEQCLFGYCSPKSMTCVSKVVGAPCKAYLTSSNECGVELYCSRDLKCQKRATAGQTCYYSILEDSSLANFKSHVSSHVQKQKRKSKNNNNEVDSIVGSCRRDLTCVKTSNELGQGVCQARSDYKSVCHSLGYGAPTCKLPYYCPSDVFDFTKKFVCASNLVSLRENQACEFDPYFKIQNRAVCSYGLSCNLTLSTCQRRLACSDSSNYCFSGATHQYLTSYCQCDNGGSGSSGSGSGGGSASTNGSSPGVINGEGTCAIYEQGCKFTNADIANIRSCVVEKCYGGSDNEFPYASDTLTRVMFDTQACPFKKCFTKIEPYYCCLINFHKQLSTHKFKLPFGVDEALFIDSLCRPKEEIPPLGTMWLLMGLGIVSVAIFNVIVTSCLIYKTKQAPMTMMTTMTVNSDPDFSPS